MSETPPNAREQLLTIGGELEAIAKKAMARGDESTGDLDGTTVSFSNTPQGKGGYGRTEDFFHAVVETGNGKTELSFHGGGSMTLNSTHRESAGFLERSKNADTYVDAMAELLALLKKWDTEREKPKVDALQEKTRKALEEFKF